MINSLVKIKTKSKKRLGRGMGSGRGSHTSSRGQKGQKSRRKIHPLFEGTKVKKSLIQRLPLLRGKSKLKSLRADAIIVQVAQLEVLPGGVVDTETLIKNNLVPSVAKYVGVKVLGNGKLTKKFEVVLPVSSGARRAIEAAGGEVKTL